MTVDSAQLSRIFDGVATNRGVPSEAVTALLKRHRSERKAVSDGKVDLARKVLADDLAKLERLGGDEEEVSRRLGELSLSGDLDGEIDAKGLASSRRELEAIRCQRVELAARIEAARKRIAAYEADEAARRRALAKAQADELSAALRKTITDNNARFQELLIEVNRLVSNETALRLSAAGARSRSAGV